MQLKINNKKFSYFNQVTLEKKIDRLASSIRIITNFNPYSETHKELLKPLSYHKCQLFSNGGKLLFTGFLVNHTFDSNSKPTLPKISGMSLPGILENANISTDDYPLEKNNLSLRQIAKEVLKPFGIEFIVASELNSSSHTEFKEKVSLDPKVDKLSERSIPYLDTTTGFKSQRTSLQNSKDTGVVRVDLIGDMDKLFDKVVAEPTESVKSFLTKLCSQRDILMTHNEKGQLVFFRMLVNQKPKRSYSKTNDLSMSLSTNGQGIHSSITVTRQPDFFASLIGDGADSKTVENPLLSNVFKPKVKILTEGKETDLALKKEMSKELQNITWSIALDYVDTDLNTGDIVSVQNEEVFLYEKTNLVISGIKMSDNSKKEVMTLTLHMPETYTGETPKNIFV